MFFLSSPLPPPPAQQTPIFGSSTKFTDHYTHNDAHLQVNKYPKLHHFYAPHSPSPLRSSRNANLMTSPTRHNDFKTAASLLSSSPLRGGFEDEVENQGPVTGFGMQESSCGKINTPTRDYGYGIDGGNSSLITPPNSTTHAQHPIEEPTLPSSFHSTTPAPTTSHNVSQWSLRSRESSPTSLLASQTSRNRETRKSRFLDRIRRRRDDERSEVVGDQVLRMDFVKERRAWEESMARKAALEVDIKEQEDEDVSGDTLEEMSPTEEYDYDDLIRAFESQAVPQPGGQDEFIIDSDSDIEDEDYERLFRDMEILSQTSKVQSQPHLQPAMPTLQPGQSDFSLGDGNDQDQHRVDGGHSDESMDIT